jgi:hypothetical protein
MIGRSEWRVSFEIDARNTQNVVTVPLSAKVFKYPERP